MLFTPASSDSFCDVFVALLLRRPGFTPGQFCSCFHTELWLENNMGKDKLKVG